MKLRSNPFARISLALVSATVITSTQAADQFWNPLPLSDNWANSVWSATSGGGSLTTWTASNDAIFDQVDTYTVTVNAAQTATNLNIKAGTVTFAGTSGVAATTITIDSGATLGGPAAGYIKSGTTAATVNGTLDLTSGPGGGRLTTLSGSGTVISSIRYSGVSSSFSGNFQDILSPSLVRAAILWNSGVAGTLTLSGNNSTMSGDVLMSIGSSVLKLNSANALSSTSFLRLEGGAGSTLVELASGDLTRTWAAGSNAAGAGGINWIGTNAGFYATGGDRNLTFVTTTGGAIPASVVWGSNGFTSSTVLLGAAASTHKLTWTNDLNLNGAARTISCADGTAAVESGLSGIISNSSATASSLTKAGTGYLLLSGSINGATGGAISLSANGGTMEISGVGTTTYTGNVTVGGGNLLVKRNDALGSGAGITTCNGGGNQGTLQFDASGGDLSFSEGITLQMRSSIVLNNTSSMKPSFNNLAGNTTLSGTINGTTGGAVTKISSDGGLLTILGILTQSGDGTNASTRVSNLQGAGNAEISGTITQLATPAIITHRVEKMGAGTWKFSNAGNTYTGGTRILQGTLEVTGFGNGGANGVLGAATNAAGNIQLNGGTLKYSGLLGETSDRLFTVGASGGTIEASGAGALVLGNPGAIISANGGATGFQMSFASGVTTIAVTDLSEVSPGMDITRDTGLDTGTKVLSVDYSSGLVTIDKPTIAVSGALSPTNTSGAASGTFDRVLTLTGANTGPNEIKGILADAANLGKLGISKSGAGTWVLSGANTYTGATSVTAGTLSIVGASHASPITVSSGATLGLTLGSPVTSTSAVTFSGATAKVNVSGAPVAATLLTATSITGTPVLDPAIPGYALAIEDSGTTLKLKAAVSNNYSTWATTNGVSGQAIQLDHDNDGVSNGVEYFVGGPTGNTTGFTSLPSVITTAGVRSITWVKAASYTGVYGTDFAVETSATLVGAWATEASPGTVAISGTNVTYTFPAGPVKNFARLKVTGP